MKLECPHCWQHYEIAKGDLNREFTCLNCEQTFRAQDAVILDRGKKYSPWLLGGMGAIIILLLLLNFWSWQRMSGPRKPDPQNAPIAAQVVQSVTPQPDLQTVMAPLYRTLKEFRSENEKMQKQITLLTQARQDLAERLEKAEKQLASNNGNARFEAQEESINTLKIKINSANAQIKLLDEYHKQLLKGLTELRQDLQVLNLNERITTLEKKADNIDLTPINRRIDRLDALVNAIRTVDR